MIVPLIKTVRTNAEFDSDFNGIIILFLLEIAISPAVSVFEPATAGCDALFLLQSCSFRWISLVKSSPVAECFVMGNGRPEALRHFRTLFFTQMVVIRSNRRRQCALHRPIELNATLIPGHS